MADTIQTLWLLVTTNLPDYSGTAAYLEMTVATSTAALIECDTHYQQNDQQSLGTGRSAQFKFTATTKGVHGWPAQGFTRDQITSIDLEIEGSNANDAWLPASIWVIADTGTEQHLLVAYPTWTRGCFSADSSDCENTAQQSYILYPAEPAAIPFTAIQDQVTA